MSDLELTQALLTGAPYFGSAFLASSGLENAWAIPQILQCIEKKPLRILLLGCWLGAGFPRLKEALMERPPGSQVTCVDDFRVPADKRTFPSMKHTTWTETFLKKAQEEGVLINLLRHNLKAIQGQMLFQFHHQDILDFLQSRPGDSWDLIWIDANRVIPSFEKIFDAAAAHLSLNGILCGTGYHYRPETNDTFGVTFAIEHERHFLPYGKDRWFYPEVSKILSMRLPDMQACGVWSMYKKKAGWVPLKLIPPDDSMAICKKVAEYTIYKSGEQYIVLHESISEAALFSERLGDRDIPGLLFLADDETAAFEIAAQANDRIQRKRSCRIDQTKHYDLVRCSDRYVATLRFRFTSPLYLFGELLGESELPPTLLTGATETEVREKIINYEAQLDATRHSIPVSENYMGYSLYSLPQGKYLAISHRVGEIRPFQDMIGDTEIYPQILRANNRNVILRRIQDISKSCFQNTEQQGWR